MGRWRDGARLALKSVRTPSQPAFRPSMGGLPLHAEPEAGALVPNTRFKHTPCAVPPAVSWAPPSAGAEKWEKWRKWPACQKYESDGPADCTVAFARRRRRRNDDDKGSISTFEISFQRAPYCPCQHYAPSGPKEETGAKENECRFWTCQRNWPTGRAPHNL